MAVLDIRQRTGWLFMGVIVGHILLISAQVNTQRGVPMLEEVTFGTFAEIQRGAASAFGTIRDNWVNYVALQDVRAENAKLKQELASLQVGLQQERALAQQSRSLQGLLELKSTVQLKTTAAAVIAGGASPEFCTMTIDKRSEEHTS